MNLTVCGNVVTATTYDQIVGYARPIAERLRLRVSLAKQAAAEELAARVALGEILIHARPALVKMGRWSQFIDDIGVGMRTVQEIVRTTNDYSTGGVLDVAKVSAAQARVVAWCKERQIDSDPALDAARKPVNQIGHTDLRLLTAFIARMDRADTRTEATNKTRVGAFCVRVDPNLSRAGQPTHQPPAVSGLQVEHGDKVVWSAQLGRWMVGIGEVLYELHEYTRVRKGQTVTWPGGVTPAGYDDDDEDFDDDDEFGDDRVSDDGFDDDDDLGDEDAAFADDDEPLEDEEEDRESGVVSRESCFTHATPSTTGDTDDEDDDDDSERHDGTPARRVHGTDRAPLDAVAATGHHTRSGRGASGQQLTFAGLFEAADGIARAMADLTTKLQHDPLISQRDLDAAERAVDDAKLAIAEARHRLTEERP